MNTSDTNFQDFAMREARGTLAAAQGWILRSLALRLLWCLMLGVCCFSTRAAFVYETPDEFITSGDFDGDGRTDALVVDKITGNARVGYQSPAGALVWSLPFVSGIENVTGVGIGKFVSTGHDAIAATAPGFNRIALLDVPISGSNSLPTIILPGVAPATNGLIAAWDFFGLPSTTVSTATPATIPATVGIGTLDVSAFGLGSPQGTNPERTAFGGSISNVFPGSVDGNPGTALALANNSANGKSAVFSFSMTGLRDLVVSFATRGTATGFNSGVWAWSTDGVNYVTLAGVNTGSTNVTFTTAVVNFASETGLNNAATVFLRYTLSGATSTGGNNRIDNIQLNATPAPVGGLGPHGLAGLPAPAGTNAPYDRLLCASSQNPAPAARLNLLGLAVGTVVSSSEQIETAPLERLNPLPIASNLTFAVGLTRNTTNDALHIWQFTNAPGIIAALSNLPPGSDYTFGRFNDEPYPRLLLYVPGQSNVVVQSLIVNGSGFAFGPATVNTFASPVQRVFYVAEQTNGLAVIQFGDGVVGLRPPSDGGGQLQASYNFGAGAAGNVVSAVVPLGLGKFALLSSLSNSTASTFAQVFTASGGNYTQTSSNTLPAVTSVATRGNVWLFQIEPFVSSAASLIGSLSAPAWSSTISGLPGTLAVRVESDGGTTTGLNNPSTNNFGAPPAGTVYVLPNQYRDDISFFGYGPARAPEPSVVTIAPPPGAYGGPIQISFTKQNATDNVQYRKTTVSPWQLYSGPFPLTNDATIEFYGQTTSGTRSRTQTASYALGNIAVSPEPLATLPGSGTNPPAVNPTIPHISAIGTVFYGRRGSNTVPSIWAIDLDGSGETLITTGREPRVSRDGRWLAFWRDNDPLTNQFSLWLRDLPAGQESRWDTRTNRYVGFDWQRDNTNLIFAVNGLFWRIGLSTPPVAFPLGSDTRQGAPAVNPVDGRVALQIIYPGSTGLYLAPSNLTSRQNLGLNIFSPRWPAWSPDGTRIAVADDPYISQLLDAGQNLWVVKFGAQTNVYQITALTGGTNGFPNGAVWSPGGNKLVTAGRIGGVNGLWVIPVSTDGSSCHCQPELISTLPGDPIDFVGSVLTTTNGSGVSYANLGLYIRLDPSLLVVYWSTNYDGYSLESAAGLPAGLSWSSVTGPYFRAGPYFEYRESRAALAGQKYFRLHFPGVLVLTPPEPAMALHLEPNAAVLNWPLNYVGYSIEATTNLSPPALWLPLTGAAVNTNGVFEYRRVLPGPPQEFYRLRGP